MSSFQHIKNSPLVWMLISTSVVLWAAFYNGFPIVYPDTSTYLASGFGLETPMDRPITYGLFIMISSIYGSSIWLTVFIQSFMLVYLLFMVLREFSSLADYSLKATLCILVLCLFSSLPWIGGMLLADIFTPISIFTLFVLVFGKHTSKSDKIVLYSFFVLSNAMHISHIMINVLLIMTMLIFSRIPFMKTYFSSVKTGFLFLLMGISLSGILIMSSAMSKSKHIFYMGRMVENGILKKYLDENCGTHNYKICAYKDSLPQNADRFLWDFKNSPVYKLGGWKECKKEFNEIISATFTQSDYVKMHALASLKGTTEQLTAFSVGEGNIAFGKETALYQRIEKYTGSIEEFAGSKQSREQLASIWAISYTPHKLFIYLSLLFLVTTLIVKPFRKRLHPTLIMLIVFTLLGIFYNDFVCASLSTVANRFGCRVIWMIPCVFIFVLLHLWSLRTKKT